MYYIRVKYFFYQGTYNTPKSGALRIGLNGISELTTEKKIHGRTCPICTFESREQAHQHIKHMAGGRLQRHSKNTYSSGWSYGLRYGEYAKPEYTIIKKRTQNKGV